MPLRRKRKPISISPRHSSVESGGDDEEVQQVLSGETEPPTIPAVVTTGGTTGSTSTATTTTGPTSTATTTTSPTATSASASLPKKRRGSGFISEEDEEKMIEWLQENRFIYDMKSKQYKDKSGKTTAWQEQADKLGFEGKLKFILNCLFFVFILLKR